MQNRTLEIGVGLFLLAGLLALLLLALLAPAGPAASLWQGLGWAALAAALVLLAGWLGAPELRRAWRS